MSSFTRPSRAARALPLLGVVLATAAAACGGGVAGAASSPRPGGSGPAALTPTPTPNATMAGPTSFAAWTARQGFGGGSGITEVQKGADWLNRNTGAPDRTGWADWWSSTADGLVFWLDTHPATACWAAYHDAMSQGLRRMQGDFATIRAAVGAGENVPGATASDMLATADRMVVLEQPANCP